MEDQKRLLTAIFLIAGFLYVWFGFVSPPPPPAPKPATVAATTPIAGAVTSTPGQQAPTSSKQVLTSEPGVRFSTETALTKLTLTSTPGTFESVELKKYRVTKEKNAANVQVVPFMGGKEPPLVWTFTMDGQRWSDDGQGYAQVASDKGHIVYERKLTSDVSIRKTLTWSDASYTAEEVVEVVNRGGAKKVQAEVRLSSGQVGATKPTMMNPGDPLHVVAYVNEKSARQTVQNVEKGAVLPKGDVSWAGIDSRYFLLTAIPTEGRWSEIASSLSAPASGASVGDVVVTASYPTRDAAANATVRYVLKLYAGPKDLETLQAEGHSLEKAIDLGDWLGPIARAIHKFFRILYSYIPNYGVAIILLTVLVRLALFPLSQMQAKSMKKMQQHKPELDALKEKHKDNKEAYSREMMTYMRTHRINPMGGCLLLLPQLPVFFALYRVLYNSIELRHAPFALWIHDLSAHDPYFVTPVILGALMFIQQKLTPMPGTDPAQQTMMKIMPVMFSVFMLFLPAGLTLYILVSTLWGIGQQYWVQKDLKKALVRTN